MMEGLGGRGGADFLADEESFLLEKGEKYRSSDHDESRDALEGKQSEFQRDADLDAQVEILVRDQSAREGARRVDPDIEFMILDLVIKPELEKESGRGRENDHDRL